MMRGRTVAVPGGELHIGVEGAGPVLLLCPGASGDPLTMRSLGRMLLTEYTVIGYRKRTRVGAPLTIAEHADDVHHLLAARTDRPAAIIGSGFGSLIALDVAARYPGQVDRVVAHEAPLVDLLPVAERAEAEAAYTVLADEFRERGINPATMRRLAAFTGARHDDGWESRTVEPAPDPQAVRDLTRFFAEEAMEIYRHPLDLDALRAAPTRIAPATGSTASGHLAFRCTEALAALLGTTPVRFPGAHGGPSSHPRQFAETLSRTLGRLRTAPAAQLS
jgi:pimeloyl-ACP methyl ester carboxylesterase